MTLKEFVLKYAYSSPIEVRDDEGEQIVRLYEVDKDPYLDGCVIDKMFPAIRPKRGGAIAQAVLVILVKYGLLKDRQREQGNFFKSDKDAEAYSYNSFKGRSDTDAEPCPQ